MRPDGPLCPCGQRGCAEAVGSGRAVGRDRTRLGDVIAATAWTVQLCAMTLDVDVVAVGGGMTNGGSAFLDALRAALAERAAASPVVAATGLAERLVLAPDDVPVGSLGRRAGGHRTGAGDVTAGRRAVVGRHVVTPDGVLAGRARRARRRPHRGRRGRRAARRRARARRGSVGRARLRRRADQRRPRCRHDDATGAPRRARPPRCRATASRRSCPTVVTCPPEQRVAALDALAERPAEIAGAAAARGARRGADAGADPAGRPPGGPPRPARSPAHLRLVGQVRHRARHAGPGAARRPRRDRRPRRPRRGRVDRAHRLLGRPVRRRRRRRRDVRHPPVQRHAPVRSPRPRPDRRRPRRRDRGRRADLRRHPRRPRRRADGLAGPRPRPPEPRHRRHLGARRRTPRRHPPGSVRITIDGGAVRTAGGVLAGSVLSLDEAVRNLVEFAGCSVPEAIGTVTATPARLLGLADRGRLVPGREPTSSSSTPSSRVVTTVVGGATAWRS